MIGFALGALQMILYVVYRYCKTPPQLGEKEVEAAKLPEVSLDMLKLGTVSSPEPIAVVRQTTSVPAEMIRDLRLKMDKTASSPLPQHLHEQE